MGGRKLLLSVNAGSSSLKVSLFDVLRAKEPLESIAREEITSMPEAVRVVMGEVGGKIQMQPEDTLMVAHRIVHGGEKYSSATLVTPELHAYLEELVPLAPNHMPNSLVALEAFTERYPNSPQIACFDTGFFQDVPETAKLLPLPLHLQRELGIRRYGFHGLSYEYLMENFRDHEGETAYRGRVILAHLGSGVSVAACKNGKPIDMSMGFTPVSGLMMSTRSGDIEPGVLDYIREKKHLSTSDITQMVAHQSGLLGVSGLTADMYELLQAQATNPDAKLAVELFCSRIQKTIGGFMAALGGVDSIIFTAGIGERSAEVRARILGSLEFAGVVIDSGRNQRNERLISSDASRVGVHVIPTHEEQSILAQAKAFI